MLIGTSFEAIAQSFFKSRGRRVLFTLAAALLLFVYGLGYSVTSGVGMADESWFLQLLHRVSSGEVLYRDIFYGVTPLSVWLSLIPVYLFGAEILVLKAVLSACFVATVLLSSRIAGRLGCNSLQVALVAGTLLVYAPPDPNSAYTPVAYVFLLCCFLFTLSWLDSGKNTALALAGAAAALSFLSKQNIGALAMMALVPTVFLGLMRGTGIVSRERLSGVILVSATFLGVVLAGLLPVVFAGGFEQFLDYGFMNKRTYLKVSSISYFAGFNSLLAVFESPSVKNLAGMYMALPVVFPFFAFLFLGAAWVRADAARRRVCLCAFFFSSAAFLGAFPRFDFDHLVYMIPIIVLGTACGWQEVRKHLPRRLPGPLAVAVCLWLMIGLGVDLTYRARLLGGDSYRVSSLPHYRGALMEVPFYHYLLDYKVALAEYAPDGKIFLVFPEAGLGYLASGQKNPTPFDYPIVSAFGLTGEQNVIQRIAKGEIRTVCMRSLAHAHPRLEVLRPARLEEHIQTHMERIEDLGLCTLYTSRVK
jgi:hypothetical protein